MQNDFDRFQGFIAYQAKITHNLIISDVSKVKTEEMDTGINEMHQECDQKQNIFYQHQNLNLNSSENLNLRKLRKNKKQKLNQIKKVKRDDGRGGNCVAANLSKTFIRIIESNIKYNMNQASNNFRNLLKRYEINYQKENTFILVLILHTFASQNLISFEIYQHIVLSFLESIRMSSENCIQKIKDQEKRKVFHTKNRKMYVKFAQIVQEIFQRSVKNINKGEPFNLKDLQAIISDVYQRKQRETEKSVQKMISIILNHQELRQFFDCNEIDVETAFFEAIDFAFRRNLPKKCKQIKQKVSQLFGKLRSSDLIHSEEDKYFISYLALELIEEKSEMIWDEFILNLRRKQEFNKTKDELIVFEAILTNEIPQKLERVREAKGFSYQRSTTIDLPKDQKTHEVKVEEDYGNSMRVLQRYEQIRKAFEF